MSLENAEALAGLQREFYRSRTIAKQREALWERIGTGEVKPINLAVKQRVDRLRTRITASAIRAEADAVAKNAEINTLFASVGEKPDQIPLPLYERQLLAHLAIVSDPSTTVIDLKDTLGLHESKTGKPLGRQHLLFALRKSADSLYERTHKAHGKFATPDEVEVWEQIRDWTADRQKIPTQSDFLLHRRYRDNLVKEWLWEKTSEEPGNADVLTPTPNGEIPVPTEITLEPGRTYVVKTGALQR